MKAEGIPLSAIKACVPVDGDSYDLPMQLKAVEEGPAASYTLDFGDPTKLKKLPTITILAKGKRAASLRIKFGDEALQKDLSAVTHVAKGKNIPPFLVLHVAGHPETKGNRNGSSKRGGSGRSGNRVSGRREEPHHDKCRLGLAR